MALSKMKIIIYVNRCAAHVQHNELIYPNQGNFQKKGHKGHMYGPLALFRKFLQNTSFIELILLTTKLLILLLFLIKFFDIFNLAYILTSMVII